jgi:cell division septation protein DedD
VVSVDEIRAGHLRNASRTELAYPLYDFLTALQPLNGFALVMIDEAQSIPNALLEEIRILADMENGQKLLQLLLIGQPELERRLAMPEMRQLTQRLTVRCELEPLGRDDVMPYLAHRLGVAGRSEPLFLESDCHLIWKMSEGIPRVINLLCDRTLTRAARAGAAMVMTEHIAGAAKDLKLSPPQPAAVTAKSATSATPSPRPVPKDDKPARQGLPADYRMRHDAHYVEELISARGDAPAVTPNPRAVTPNPRLEEKPPTALVPSRPLPPLDGDLDEASQAELREFERSAHEASAARRRRAKVAAMFSLVTIAAAAATWMYLSSSAGTVQPRVESTPNVATVPATSAVQQPPPQPAGPGAASRPADHAVVAAPEPELSAEVIGRNGFLVQMATFTTAHKAAQSVQQLQSSGYKVYERRVTLADGRSAYAVYLGPYADFQRASVELERARKLPDYTAGRIVPLE